MKVLQTLGRHGGNQEGIFQYKRTQNGVVIDSSIGQAQLNPREIIITNDEWQLILLAIANANNVTFRLSGTNQPNPPPPHQVLYELISDAVPNPQNGWNWMDSWRAYVAAILEHEGTIDLYHGPLGRGVPPAFIALARDI